MARGRSRVVLVDCEREREVRVETFERLWRSIESSGGPRRKFPRARWERSVKMGRSWKRSESQRQSEMGCRSMERDLRKFRGENRLRGASRLVVGRSRVRWLPGETWDAMASACRSAGPLQRSACSETCERMTLRKLGDKVWIEFDECCGCAVPLWNLRVQELDSCLATSCSRCGSSMSHRNSAT